MENQAAISPLPKRCEILRQDVLRIFKLAQLTSNELFMDQNLVMSKSLYILLSGVLRNYASALHVINGCNIGPPGKSKHIIACKHPSPVKLSRNYEN